MHAPTSRSIASSLTLAALSGCLLLAACATTPVAGPEIAPPPFTAAAIRDATQPGRTYVFRITQGDGTVALRTLTFTHADEASATIRATMTSADGEPMGEATDDVLTWEQLVAHAAWPRELTEISPARVEVPAGTFDATLYTVRERADGAQVLTRAWFARELPGAPVRLEQIRGGARIFAMELLEHRPGVAP